MTPTQQAQLHEHLINAASAAATLQGNLEKAVELMEQSDESSK